MTSPQSGDPGANRAPPPSDPAWNPASSDSQPTLAQDVTISSTAHVRLPPFWAHDPILWFVQVENHFNMRRITSDTTKYQHVVEVLPPTAAAEVRDILLAPPSTNAYATLKDALVSRLMSSEQHRIQQVLSTEDLGDRKPSQLLRHLQYLLGDKATTIDPAIFRELFLQRLPANVRVALATASNLSLNQLAEPTDSVLDIAPPVVAAVPGSAPDSENTEVGQLRREVAKLTELVARITDQPRQARRDPSPSRRRASPSRQRFSPPPRRTPSPVDPNHCWYHQTFGRSARRCQQPCSWSSGNWRANH